MKSLAERNNMIVGAIGCALTAALVVGALEYDALPFISGGRDYQAYFAEAAGLSSGAPVQVAGYDVGKVQSVELDGARVLVSFDVDKKIRLGDRTEAAIKTKTLLGAKVLAIAPLGDGRQDGPIPLDRTTSPYQLPDALGDLTTTISGLNTDQLSASLSTLAEAFRQTPPELRVAVQGVARFSDTIDRRDAALRNLLSNANAVSTVLGQRSQQIVSLVHDTNALLAELETQSDSLDHLASNVSALSTQLTAVISDNRAQLKPAIDEVNSVLTIVDKHKEGLKKSIRLLRSYAMSLGESVGSGPFFKAYLANLLPGQFIQPFIDAAFSDLGLDPNVLQPSELVDPPTGQPATPALPEPYPRTGQGGEPRLTLPDAITGNPDDPRYPYREPLPAPPPGGPPPGPPALDPTVQGPTMPEGGQ